MTPAVHDALEALLALRAEHNVLTAADVADAVLTNDLDEAEAEELAHELESHGAAPEAEEEEFELDLSVGTSLYTTDSFQMFLTRPAATRCSPPRKRSSWRSASRRAT
jgi:hypothetical protein